MYNEGFINTHLLSVNVNVFQYVFRLNVLFPPILKRALDAKCLGVKSCGGPVLCAVDDLNIYTTNDDSHGHGHNDIYDLLNNPTFYSGHNNDNKEFKFDFNTGSGKKSKQPSQKSTNMGYHYPVPIPTSNPQIHSVAPSTAVKPKPSVTNDFTAPIQINTSDVANHHQDQPLALNNQIVGSFNNNSNSSANAELFQVPGSVTSQSITNLDNSVQSDYLESLDYHSLSHFNLNMIGINQYYFNDFKPHPDNFEYSSSSNESYVSPLDDELFKRKNNKSSPQDQPDPSVLSSSVELAFNRDDLDLDLDYDYDYDNELDFELDFHGNSRNPHSNFSSNSNSNSNSVTSSSMNINTPMSSLPTSSTVNSSIKPNEAKKRKSTVKLINQKKSKLNDAASSNNQKVEVADSKADAKFECNYCQAKFKVKGYLTRHLKKHQSFKAFKCPFYDIDESPSNTSTANVAAGGKGAKCHPTGGFSRRDTYKTHLKALHFIYPPGTKSNERSSSSGRCGGCFKFFDNNVDWLLNHIEKNFCKGTVKPENSNDQDNEDHGHESGFDQDDYEDDKMTISESIVKSEFDHHIEHNIF